MNILDHIVLVYQLVSATHSSFLPTGVTHTWFQKLVIMVCSGCTQLYQLWVSSSVSCLYLRLKIGLLKRLRITSGVKIKKIFLRVALKKFIFDCSECEGWMALFTTIQPLPSAGSGSVPTRDNPENEVSPAHEHVSHL